MTNPGLSDLQRRQIEEMRQRSCGIYTGISMNKHTEELPKSGSSFSVRLMAALLLLAGFLQFHMSGGTFADLKTEKAIEAVCQDTDLQKVLDSVRMEK